MLQATRRMLLDGRQAVQVAALTFLAALAGLLTQPALELSVLWPANAVLAGRLLRDPGLVGAASWAGAGAALVLAGIAWGEPPVLALAYGLVNLTGAHVAWRTLTASDTLANLRHPRAIGRILLAGAAAAGTHTAAAGLLMAWLQPAHWPLMLATWFFGQLLSYSAILPALLLLPRTNRRVRGRGRARPDPRARPRLEILAPLASLIIGLILCFLVGGPGILAFPIPPLLYCTLVYRQHTTAWLTLCTATVLMLGTAYGWIPFGDGPALAAADPWAMISLRLGVLLLVVAPLIMSSALTARSDMISSLNRALDHDVLTSALSRHAFLRNAQESLLDPAVSRGTGLLMLDIDHFKQLNDTHGHAAGDLALQVFAQAIRAAIRPHDLFGRLGGEEFGIVLPDTGPAETAAIAERLRACAAHAPIPFAAGASPLHITVSIGAIHDSQQPLATLNALLSYADQAMYRAKRAGRDCVSFHDSRAATSQPPAGPGTGRLPGNPSETPVWHRHTF